MESDNLLKTRMGIVPEEENEEEEEEEEEEEDTFAFLREHTAGHKMTGESQMQRLMPWASEIILTGVAYKVSPKPTLYTPLFILASQPFNVRPSTLNPQPLNINSTSTLNT